MNIRYRVELHQSERDELKALLVGGKQPVRRLLETTGRVCPLDSRVAA